MTSRTLASVAVVVRDYDEAIAYYVGQLGFELIEDTPLPQEDKRWVVVAPSAERGARIVLGRAKNRVQAERIGNQTGGRVAFFLETDDFDRDYQRYVSAGVRFIRPPRETPHAKVAVFEDVYGNRWDLLQPKR